MIPAGVRQTADRSGTTWASPTTSASAPCLPPSMTLRAGCAVAYAIIDRGSARRW